MSRNFSHKKGLGAPVTNISWSECLLFCNRLSERDGLEKVYQFPHDFEDVLDNPIIKGGRVDYDIKHIGIAEGVIQNLHANGYRLPTELEWEYAARAGNEYLYPGSNNLEEVGYYNQNTFTFKLPVGQKQPNALGLYDMSGSTNQWCWDGASKVILEGRIVKTEQHSTSTGHSRITRGGDCHLPELYSRLSRRGSEAGFGGRHFIGFRLCRTLQS